MMISLIVAYDQNFVMGNNNTLPWQISDDLKLFKKNTLNKPIIMGRKTFDSIGRPLPNRRNIILTRQTNLAIDGCGIFHSTDELLGQLQDEKEIMIIGGAEIFKLFIPIADKFYLSKVNASVKGDVYFPLWDQDNWQQISSEIYQKNETNEFSFDYQIWQRVKSEN